MPFDIPSQTPLFHAIHKDRYSRQKQIQKIQDETKRILIAYVANVSHPGGNVNRDDIIAFGDLLAGKKDIDLDLLIQSPGGDIDQAEKIIHLCRSRSKSFRVIIPERAKSAATVITLGSDEIIMSDTSELGPIDPQIVITTPDGKTMNRPAMSFLDGLEDIKSKVKEEKGLSPVYFPLLQQLDPALIDYCKKAIDRSKVLAEEMLSTYMLKSAPSKAKEIAGKLADTKRYPSHGALITAEEAKEMGLNVTVCDPNSNLWQAVWRLYCEYELEIRTKKYVKIFESEAVSLTFQ